jgi:hypothetical protein
VVRRVGKRTGIRLTHSDSVHVRRVGQGVILIQKLFSESTRLAYGGGKGFIQRRRRKLPVDPVHCRDDLSEGWRVDREL